MLYDLLDTVKASQRVRLAKEELHRWQRRYDRYRGDDQTRFMAEIKTAEKRLTEARTALRLLQDRRAVRLPEAESPEAAPTLRLPAFGA